MKNLTKRQKILIGVALVLILTGITVYLIKKRKKSDPFEALVSEAKKGEDGKSSPAKTKEELIEEVNNDSSFPLKMGKKGKRVEQLQRYITTKKGAKLAEYGHDGVWGTETEAAVQSAFGKNEIKKSDFIDNEIYLMPVSKWA